MLRQPAQHREFGNRITGSDPGAGFDDNMSGKARRRSDCRAFLHNAIGSNLHVGSQFGSRMYDGRGMYQHFFVSRMTQPPRRCRPFKRQYRYIRYRPAGTSAFEKNFQKRVRKARCRRRPALKAFQPCRPPIPARTRTAGVSSLALPVGGANGMARLVYAARACYTAARRLGWSRPRPYSARPIGATPPWPTPPLSTMTPTS